jgi:hypothetical protein
MSDRRNITIKEGKTMRKIINILFIMICFTVLNTTSTKGMLKDFGIHSTGCGKYEYTNNSTIAEVPTNLF